MSIDLGRRLVAAGLVPPREVEAALFISIARAVPLARVLLDRGAITERALEEELERVGGLGLRRVVGATELVDRLPKAMCRRLAALPTRLDPQTNTVDVVAADPLDPHVASELGFHLGATIRVFRAPIAAVEDAIRRLELDETKAAPPPAPDPARPRRATPPFPHGAPSTVPPPPTEETPIPLVRRITALPPPPAVTAAEDAPQESIPLPLRKVKPASPVGSISFPSQPPDAIAPDEALRIAPPETPPYGSPALLAPRVTREWTPEDVAAIMSQPGEDLGPRPTLKGLATPAPMLDWNDDAGRAAPPPEPPAPPPPPPGEGTRRTLRPPLYVPEAMPAEGMKQALEPEPVPSSARPRRLRAPDGRAVIAALAEVTDRDEVVRLALRGLRLVAERIAVFAIRRDGFHGWACNVAFGDPDALRELVIPQALPSIFATAAAASFYLGPIPRTAAHEGLLRIMETSSGDVAAIAVKVGGRAAMILVADDLEDTMLGTRWMEELAQAIGEALSRLLGVKG